MIIRFQLFKLNRLLLYLTLFSFGCSSKEGEVRIFSEKKVDKVSVLLGADSSNEIAVPAWIKPVSGGFLLYDYGLQKISRFDLNGQSLFSFGKKGRGPGEFQSVGGFWKFDNKYLVYDINARKIITYDQTGNPVGDLLLEFVEFPNFPVGIEAINVNEFVMPSGGKKGTLLAFVNIESEYTRYIGKAVSEKSGFIQSPEVRRKVISSGNIPDMYKNRVQLSSNQTGLFSFQQTTGLLEKYAHSGELIWQKNLKLPVLEGLFKKLLKENKQRIVRGEFLLPFSYANGISANEKGVLVLLNVGEKQPVTVAWVPNSGEMITAIIFQELQNPPQLPFRFALSGDGSHILFVNTLAGKIYKAPWPL